MAAGLTWQTLWITVVINLVFTAIYVILYSIFSVQRINARVYFCRWFVKDDEDAKKRFEGLGKIDLNPLHYLHAFNWMCDSLRMDEEKLMKHAGLDMVLHLRLFIMAWKIFVPISIVGLASLLPVYLTQSYLDTITAGAYTPSKVDEVTMANLAPRSPLFWLPCCLAYLFSAWTLWVIEHEFKRAARMRMEYVHEQRNRPNHFSVLVRQIPAKTLADVPHETEALFEELHPYSYLCTQTCYNTHGLAKLGPKVDYLKNRLEAATIRAEKKGVRPTARKGFCGPKVDAIELNQQYIDQREAEIREKQEKVLTDPNNILPATFVSFTTRRGAAIAAQTLQCADPSKWITTWAPEPKDIVWSNLTIPYLQLAIRRIIVPFIVFVIVVGFTIPCGIVQGFASLSSLQKYFPWLTPILNIKIVAAFLTGFLPGFALSLFLMILPPILLALSKIEGYVAQSEIDMAAAGKHFYFKVITVFLTNVLVGSAISELKYFVENPTEIPAVLGNAIPTRASFFITFTLVNGWVGAAAELFRMFPLIMFHIKSMLLVVTPQDRIKAMSPPSPGYFDIVPELEMYFLFCFMYMIIAPIYVPFGLVFFFWGYVIFRNQFINVYSPAYNLQGSFFPHFVARAMACLVISQVVLVIVLALKQNIAPAVVLLPLPILTMMINWHLIFNRYGVVFNVVALDDAYARDKADAKNPDFDPEEFLEGAYLHPALKSYTSTDVESGEGTAEISGLLRRSTALMAADGIAPGGAVSVRQA